MSELQIDVNDKNEIMGYALIGGFDNGIEIDSSILPTDFESNFEVCKYLYVDEQVKLNPDYKAYEPTIPNISPTTEQIAMTALAQGCSSSLARIKTLEQAVTDLGTDYSGALERISSLEKALTEFAKSYGETIVHIRKLEEKLGESGDDGNEDGV